MINYTDYSASIECIKQQGAINALQSYFKSRMEIIEGWFNVIAPAGKKLSVLKEELNMLKNKNWSEIHK